MNQPKKKSQTGILSSFILFAFAVVLALSLFFIFSPKEPEDGEKKDLPASASSKYLAHSDLKKSIQKSSADPSVWDAEKVQKAPSSQDLLANKPPESTSMSQEKLQDLLAEAMKLVDNSKPKDAQAVLEAILKEYPNNELALTELGMIHLIDFKDPATSMGYLERAMKVNPTNRVVMSELVGVYEELGQSDNGVSFLQSLYEESPENANLAQGIGEILYNQGKSQESIPYLEKSAEENKEVSSLSLLADAYSSSSQSDKALEVRRRIVDLEKEKIAEGKYSDHPGAGLEQHAQAQIGVIEELMSQKRSDEAEEEIKKLYAMLPPESRPFLEQQLKSMHKSSKK